VPKVLLPVICAPQSPRGIPTLRSALDILLQDVLADGTGVSDVCIVASEAQLPLLRASIAACEVPAGRRITFAVQESPAGFGDAVLCAAPFVGDDPAAIVVVGDHLFSAGGGGAGSGAACFVAAQRAWDRRFVFSARDLRILYATRKIATLSIPREGYRFEFGSDILGDFSAPPTDGQIVSDTP
jgi:hypothetical protein